MQVESTSRRNGRALEDELFRACRISASMPYFNGQSTLWTKSWWLRIFRHLSDGQLTLAHIRQQRELIGIPYPIETRQLLGMAARNRRNGWFKSVTKYEDIARDILGPHMPATDAVLRTY